MEDLPSLLTVQPERPSAFTTKGALSAAVPGLSHAARRAATAAAATSGLR